MLGVRFRNGAPIADAPTMPRGRACSSFPAATGQPAGDPPGPQGAHDFQGATPNPGRARAHECGPMPVAFMTAASAGEVSHKTLAASGSLAVVTTPAEFTLKACNS